MKYFFIIVFIAACIATHAQGYTPEREHKKMAVHPVVPLQAYAFNLADVQLLDGSPFKNAMQKDAAYLLLLDPNRLLHRFYENAGLPPKGDVYGGWESDGLSGHTMGHYLSACSMMYASLKDELFKQRVDYIVGELARCQQARKTGYVGAIPKEDSIFGKLAKGEIHTSGFDLNGGWSPFYTMHKVMAGLVDAYLYCDNKQALKVATGMADWVGNTLKNLSPEQLQQMMKCEYGGMNDVLANIYAITGNKKYLALANVFFDDFVMKPLSQKIDPMPGKHSNTNVPKAIGCARLYELTGSDTDKTVAAYFWQLMVHDHSYVIGGNSNYEYCGAAGKLNDQLSDATCETCNTYNMLKLTKHLFEWQPTAELGDYYERALYNHILASQNPDDGMMCYFVPLRMGTKKQFSDSFNTFTCCVGSGMENHSKYAESIYFEDKDGNLYVNLFIASKLNWRTKQYSVTQTTAFPESDNTTIKLRTANAKQFTVFIRQPHWAKQGITVLVNGMPVEAKANNDGFLEINRTWKNDDEINVSFPKTLYTESMPDNSKRIAVLYGPLVLAGQLGDTMPDPVYGIPVLLTDNTNVSDWVKPVKGQPNTFTTVDVAKPFNTTLIPFYKTYKQHYTVYWDYFTNDEWVDKQAAYEAEKKRLQQIDERTIDIMRLGEMQPERDHNLQASTNSYTDEAIGRTAREARSGGYFSFDVKVQPDAPNILLCSYIGDDKNRLFDILIDGNKIATQELKGGETGKFFDIEYAIPAELTKNKTKVTIRVEANAGKTAGRIFGCRILKAQ
ncbi:MAG TPA: glycoside hydrolase family 127 protein [Panacibacter sp.]|nr:glycoside hydrolase family 127 protein [Panacibacter sp.]HNP43063.1 glycoside hydrolase family 127 protein [Panacibacter sp.]